MIPMHHPATSGETEAVNEDQAAHLKSLGWVRTPDPEDDSPTELWEDTIVGTTSSLGDELVLTTPDGIPLSLVPAGTVDEVLAWVDLDRAGWAERAELALAVEESSDHPRKTITEPLTAAINPED